MRMESLFDIDELESSEREPPLPKPRPRLAALEPLPTPDFDSSDPPFGRKKKKGLARLRNREAKNSPRSEGAGDGDKSESLFEGGTITLTESEMVSEVTASIFTKEPVNNCEDNSFMTPKHKRKKGGISRLKNKQSNGMGSLTSLKSQEAADLRALDDEAQVEPPIKSVLRQDSFLSRTALEPSDEDSEVAEITSQPQMNCTQTISTEQTVKPRSSELGLTQTLTSRNPVNNERDADQSSEDLDDTDELTAHYEEVLNLGDTLGEETPLSSMKASSHASQKPFQTPKPKPSATTPVISAITKSSSTVSDSLRSSKRNWEVIKSMIESKTMPEVPRTESTLSLKSANSTFSGVGLPTVRMSTARHKNFLAGQMSAKTSMVGTDELNRVFPERFVEIFIVTWNMAEQKALPENLDDLVLPDNLEYVPDILIVTTQEMSVNRKDWEVKLQETIGLTHVLFHSAQHGALHMSVFMKREIIWFCSVAEEDNVTTRVFKQIKTKGAVAISFMMFGTSFLFIGSHFKANEGNDKARIEDYFTINKTLRLPRAVVDNPLQPVEPEASLRFDSVFWAGDLNFRITNNRDRVLQTIESEERNQHPSFEKLLANEELTQAMMQGAVFQDFQEGRITFAPTYKFDIGSSNYDTSATVRIPSYTDRILFKSRLKHGIVCTKYCSIPKLTYSDHKPVYGLFQAHLKPGRDTIPLSGGQFKRDIYMQAAKLRALRRLATMTTKETDKSNPSKSSSICSVM